MRSWTKMDRRAEITNFSDYQLEMEMKQASIMIDYHDNLVDLHGLHSTYCNDYYKMLSEENVNRKKEASA